MVVVGWSTYFGGNILTKIRRFNLIREFGKGISNSKSHSYWLARFNRKISFHFRRVFPPICDRLILYNGKSTPKLVDSI